MINAHLLRTVIPEATLIGNPVSQGSENLDPRYRHSGMTNFLGVTGATGPGNGRYSPQSASLNPEVRSTRRETALLNTSSSPQISTKLFARVRPV
jgi:hypothetical protein